MLKVSALVLLAVAMAPVSAMAQSPVYSQQDANACTPDAFRLCGDAIPDVDRVTQCLIVKNRQLSPPCHAVFERLAASRSAPASLRRARY
jgi:hypothetical protein